MSFNSVNPYCLEHIVGLSESRDVVAAEDILDDNGVKLWAKGNLVSRELQAKLLQRKLAQPLEIALAVTDPVSFASVIDDGLELMANNAILNGIAGTGEALALFQEMRVISLPGPVSLLLTAMRERQRESFDHNLYTVLISLGIGAQLKLSLRDAQHLMLAALLHDLGEMYINPDYLHSPQRLAPKDWKFVAAHPLIGRMLIHDLTKLPAVVSDCVAMHHERLDGSGYPNHLGSGQPNRLGACLAVADSVAAIVARGGPGCAARVGLALRIVPEEFSREAVSAVLSVLNDDLDTPNETVDTDACIERAERALLRIDHALQETNAAAAKAPDSFTRHAALEVANVLGNVRKSLHASGVVDAAQLGSLIDDPQTQTEIVQVIKEVEWRLRNTARNIYLRTEKQGTPLAMENLNAVIEALDLEG